MKAVSDEAEAPNPDQSLMRENERLWRENRILKEERELLKRGHAVLRGPKAVKFAFLAAYHGGLSKAQACENGNAKVSHGSGEIVLLRAE